MNQPGHLLLSVTRWLLLFTPLTLLLRGGQVLGLFPAPADGGFATLPSTFFPDVTTRAFLFRMLVETAFAGWLVLICIRPRFRPRWSPVLVCLVALLAAAAAADVFAIAPYRAFVGTAQRMHGFVGLLHTAMFFIVAASVFDSTNHWRRFFHVTLFAAVVIAVMSVAQWLVHGGWGVTWIPDWMAMRHDRVTATTEAFRADARLGNPIQVAIFMFLHLFVLGLLAAWTEQRRLRVLYGGVGVLLFAAMFTTVTRAAYPALGIGLGVATTLAVTLPGASPVARRRGAIALTIVVAAAAGMFLLLQFAPSWFSHLSMRLRSAAYSIHVRLSGSSIGLQGFLERPLLGWGQENFSFVFDRFFDPRLHNEQDWWDRPHNAFVGWLAAGGIPAGLSYLGLYVSGIWLACARRVGRTLFQAVWITGMLAGYAVFNATLFDTLPAEIVFLGVLAYLHMRYVRAAAPSSGTPTRRATTIGVAVATAVLWAFGIAKFVVSDYRASHELAEAVQTHGLDVEWIRQHGRIDESAWLYPRIINTRSLVQEEARNWALVDTVQYVTSGEGAHLPATMRQRMVDDVVSATERQVRAEGEQNLEPLYLLGKCLNELGRYDEAASWLEKARKISPRRQLVLLELGRSYMGANRQRKGLEVFHAAVEVMPSLRESVNQCAIAALTVGDTALAEDMLADLFPDDGRARDLRPELAQVLWRRGRYRLLARVNKLLAENCERALARGVEDPPQSRAQWLTRLEQTAVSQWGAGQRQDAVTTLRKVIEYFPELGGATTNARRMIARIKAGEPVPRRDPVVPMTEPLR